jgi:two-component system chemotaxis sensor kinase CheA
MPAHATLLLHACAHNPTGVDLSVAQWQALVPVLRERELLPYLDLARFYGFEASSPASSGAGPSRRSLIVVRDGNVRIGLAVDRLLGEHQTVIKPLGSLFKHLRGIGGSTILGTGEVALILDVAALTQLAGQTEERRQLPGGHHAPALDSH